MPDAPLDPHLSLKDVLKVAGNISRTTLYRWVASGAFPAPEKLGPRRIGWRQSDIAAWQESRQKTTGTDAGN